MTPKQTDTAPTQANIQQISHEIDQQLIKLNNELQTLEQAKAAGNNDANTDQEIAALLTIKEKLEKSQSLAWQAHKLSLETSKIVVDAPHKKLGGALIAFSILGFIVLIAYAFK